MQSLSAHTVVEQLIDELATRRRTTARHRAAYLALARVIVDGDAQQNRPASPDLQQTPRCDWESASVA